MWAAGAQVSVGTSVCSACWGSPGQKGAQPCSGRGMDQSHLSGPPSPALVLFPRESVDSRGMYPGLLTPGHPRTTKWAVVMVSLGQKRKVSRWVGKPGLSRNCWHTAATRGQESPAFLGAPARGRGAGEGGTAGGRPGGSDWPGTGMGFERGLGARVRQKKSGGSRGPLTLGNTVHRPEGCDPAPPPSYPQPSIPAQPPPLRDSTASFSLQLDPHRSPQTCCCLQVTAEPRGRGGGLSTPPTSHSGLTPPLQTLPAPYPSLSHSQRGPERTPPRPVHE